VKGLGQIRARLAGLGMPMGVGAVAFGLRLRTALAGFETIDERLWTHRTALFWDNLASARFRDMSSAPYGELATMPGITTMWIGVVGRGIWALGKGLSWWPATNADSEGGAERFQSAHAALDVAQVVMALVISLLIVLVVLLLRQWIDGRAAAVAGVLLATEPFLVAHGAVLHTDELLWMFSLAAVIAAALTLGLPNSTSWEGQRRSAIVVGLLFAGAFLTKITALTIVPGLLFLAGWAWLRAVRSTPDDEPISWWAALKPILRLGGIAAATTAVAVFVLYPALWVQPLTELSLIRQSASMGTDGHYQFYFGEATETPGPTYYLVATPFRVTPWMLVLGALAAIVAWFRASTRGVATVLTLVAVAPFVALSLASKQLDRYGMIFVMLAAVLVGAVATEAVDEVRSRRGQAVGWLRPAGLVAAGAITLHSLVIAPWGLAYFNPLLGGSSTGQDVLAVGWGEGSEKAGPLIADLAHGRCDDVTVEGYIYFLAQFRCGEAPTDGQIPDYIVVGITGKQTIPWMQPDVTGRDLVATARIRGITYLEIYGPVAQ
jgi:hypothetical protein